MRPLHLAAAMAGLGTLGSALVDSPYTGAAAAARARNPKRGVFVGYAHREGTLMAGRNVQKRRHRAEISKLKGAPGGWKQALRQWQEAERLVARGRPRVVPPHRSGGRDR